MGSVVNAVRHGLGAIASPITGLLDMLPGPLRGILQAVCTIPPLTPIGMVMAGAEMAKAISKDPPDWAGFALNALTVAIPLGAAGALKGFAGGTVKEFAGSMTGKVGEALDQIATKYPKAAGVIDKMKVKLPDYQTSVEESVSKATGKAATEEVTQEELTKAAPTFMGQVRTQAAGMAPMMAMQMLMKPHGAAAAVPAEQSAWDKMSEADKYKQINLESQIPQAPVSPTTPTMSVSPGTTGKTNV
jgi:hypothetical protein